MKQHHHPRAGGNIRVIFLQIYFHMGFSSIRVSCRRVQLFGFTHKWVEVAYCVSNIHMTTYELLVPSWISRFWCFAFLFFTLIVIMTATVIMLLALYYFAIDIWNGSNCKGTWGMWSSCFWEQLLMAIWLTLHCSGWCRTFISSSFYSGSPNIFQLGPHIL